MKGQPPHLRRLHKIDKIKVLSGELHCQSSCLDRKIQSLADIDTNQLKNSLASDL